MSTLRKYLPSFASALLMYIVLFIIYPHYQYYIDPDGTAYLTISQRYANGDYARAVNGYWSPWSCWLTAILIKQGFAAIPASVIVNTLGATGFLFISQSFFLKFNLKQKQQWLFGSTLALFLCFAIFWQSFDDLWECFFLLATLRLMLADGFKNKPALWVLCGFIGTLAYFAKAYSFPFFILNTICCTWFMCREDKLQWLKISITAITVMILCSLPWIVALHSKYHIWTTSTSGSLNMSWYLVGHPYWKEGVGVLLPPAYPDSPYYWEDPWFVNGKTPHFWDSWQLFGLQILRLGLNCWKLLLSMMEISVFLPVVGVIALLSLRSKKIASIFSGNIKIVILSFVLFPMGYLLVNFESRYIWYMLPLGMVIGALIIENTKWKDVLHIAFPITFLAFPIWGMMKMYDEGKSEFRNAALLKKNGMTGKTFTSNAKPGLPTQRMVRLAYFSGNSYYTIPLQSIHSDSVLAEISRYKIPYNFIVSSGENGYSPVVGIFPEKHIEGLKGIKIQEVTSFDIKMKKGQ